jgi:hypothetical protein
VIGTFRVCMGPLVVHHQVQLRKLGKVEVVYISRTVRDKNVVSCLQGYVCGLLPGSQLYTDTDNVESVNVCQYHTYCQNNGLPGYKIIARDLHYILLQLPGHILRIFWTPQSLLPSPPLPSPLSLPLYGER